MFLRALDDRVETSHCVLHISNILQLPRDVLLRERRCVPGEVESRSL